MKAIFTYEDEHLGICHIVIPKIREIAKVLGNLVVTFDNGEKRTISIANSNEAVEQITQAIEAFYSR